MKRLMLGVLILMLCVLSCSCAKEGKSASLLLEERLARIENLPQGEIYRSDAAEGEAGYFSERLRRTVYGERDAEHCFGLIEDYAIYLCSFAEPCELAVFRCYAASDADRVAEMCLSRIEYLRIVLAGTDFRARADRATVTVDGRVVIMTLVP